MLTEMRLERWRRPRRRESGNGWRLTAADGRPPDGLTVFDDADALLAALEVVVASMTPDP